MQIAERAEPARHRVRAYHVAGIVLLAAVAGLLVYAFWPMITGAAAEEEAERPAAEEAAQARARVTAVVVERGDFPLRAEATGHLAPWRRAEISAEAGGLVVERPVEEGRYVQDGDLLLRLDDRDEQIELKEAQAELLKAQAAFAVQTNGDEALQSDTTRLGDARAALRQAEDAHERGMLSDAELEAARRRFEAVRVLTGTQRGAVTAANVGLAQAEQRAARARLALERTRVTAPFGGRVSDLMVEQGQRIASSQPILALLDDRRMKVTVDVLEADLVHVRRGSSARVRIPSLDDRIFGGTIYTVNPSIDPKTGTGRVTVALPNPEGLLVAGLFAYVQLETRRLRDRLVVPAEAVLVRQARHLVFRTAHGRAEWVYVTTGARSGDLIEITDGLSAGDTIAVTGHYALAHDAPVEVSEIVPIGVE